MSDDRKRRTKRPYVEPVVEQVKLRPEEAVLGNCKTSPGGGTGNPCGPTGHPNLVLGS